MKTKFKHFLQVPLNTSTAFGKPTKLMFWSPIDHCWFEMKDWEELSPQHRKFLMKQPVEMIGLRNDSPDYIAIFLKDYGREKNRKIHAKLTKLRR